MNARVLRLSRQAVAALEHLHCGGRVTAVAAAAVGVAVKDVSGEGWGIGKRKAVGDVRAEVVPV